MILLVPRRSDDPRRLAPSAPYPDNPRAVVPVAPGSASVRTREQHAWTVRDDAPVTPQRSSRRGRLPAIGVALVVLAACASDGDDTAAPSTSSATTAPAADTMHTPPDTTEQTTTTVAPATTAARPTTTVAAGPSGHYEPACHDRVTERESAGPGDDPALDVLGVVGDHPALEIELPVAVSDGDTGAGAPYGSAGRIPGGFLVTVSSSYFPGGLVAAVDLDGVVRWVRCVDGYFPGPVVAPLDTVPNRALFATAAFDAAAQEWRQTWVVLSLADGSTVATLDDLVADAGIDGAAAANRRLLVADDGLAVFGPEDGHVIDAAADGLLRLDLTTWAWSTTTVPSEFDGHPSGELQLELGTDGRLLRMGQQLDTEVRVPQSVEVDGVWVTDEALRRSVWGPTVGYLFADRGARVASWDASGAIRWTSDFVLPGREGFAFTEADGVVLSVACGPYDGTSPCPDERLVGLDADSGRELWSLPGWRIVGPVGDGVAYVTDSVDVMAGEQPTGWHVLDTTTGEMADTPTWPGVDTFRSGCCGEGDYQHAGALDGMIVAVSGQVMGVWFPAELTPATTTSVTLV